MQTTNGVRLISRDDLVRTMAAVGLAVTGDQIRRWHKAGLIPRPVNAPGRGRAKGRLPYYPPGTDQQLEALLRAHRRFRSLKDVAWCLWWAGYAVPEQPIRDRLRQLGARIDEALASLVQRPSGELTEKAWDLTDAFAVAPLRGVPARVRRRVGRDRFPTVLTQLLQFATGTFRDFEPDPVSGDHEDRAILLKGLGLDRATTDRVGASGPWLDVDILGPVLEEMSRGFAAVSFEPMARTVSLTGLQTARDQMRVFLAVLSGFVEMVRPALGPNPFGFGELARIAETLKEPREQASLVLVGLVFQRPEWAEDLTEWLTATRDVPDQVETYRRGMFLAQEVPAVAQVWTADRQRQAFRSPEAAEQLRQDMTQVGELHRAEIDRALAKWNALHPKA